MSRYDDIVEVNKSDTADEIVEIEKFNPFHDARGRFSSSRGMSSYSANPKTRAGAMAIQRSASAGYGRTLNVHRESKGESIAQNDNWLKTGQKPKTPAAVSRARYQQRKQKQQAQQQAQQAGNPNAQTKPKQTVNNTQNGTQSKQNGTLAQNTANVTVTSQQKLGLQARDWNGQPTNTHVRAVDHDQARVDGKDISKSFKADMSRGAKDIIDQVAEAQGWKKAPTVTNDKDLFNKAAVQSGRVMMRSVADGHGMTADQICTKTMSDGNSPLGGSGGKVYGSGMYLVDTNIKGKSNPGRDIASGQDESFGYGNKQMMATVHPNAKIATARQAAKLSNDYSNLSSADKARFGYDTNAYIASRGYDGVKWHDNDPRAYTTMFNQSALIFYGGVADRY